MRAHTSENPQFLVGEPRGGRRRAAAMALAAGIAAGVGLSLFGGTAWAGGVGENSVLIINPNDANSIWLGNYYKNARQIPDSNIIYLTPGATNYQQFAQVNIPAVLGEIESRGLTSMVHFVLIAPTDQFFVSAPDLVSDGCFPVRRFSLTGAYTSAFITSEILAGASFSSLPNRFYGTSNSAVAFDSQTAWFGGSASSDSTARRYMLGGQIGFTGYQGNTPQQIIDMIDRGVAAEGTRPAGTFYYMSNTSDAARNVRSGQYSSASSTIANSIGYGAQVLTGLLPTGRQDVLGVMGGFANADILNANMTILPGAFCDHLTSYALTFDENGQTKGTDWIRKGASGTSGAVEEPCNYTGKFNHARFHVYYAQGATIGEAYLRSISFFPFQNMLLGDVLARPFAWVPSVSVPDAPTGPVSGSITITPAASTARPRYAVASLDVLIDGRRVGSGAPGQPFTIDTTNLSDGWHDVRVIAYDNSPNKTAGRWHGTIVVNNRGRSASIAADVTSGPMATPVTFTVGASGGAVQEIQLVQNGRVIAARQGPSTIHVFGRTLGGGPSTVRTRAVYADGSTADSAPLGVDMNWVGGPSAGIPQAFSYRKVAAPDVPVIVELPATYVQEPNQVTYTIIQAPTQATILGGTGSTRVLRPNANATGEDTLRFTVTNADGTSTPGVVTLVYGSQCPADFDGDGFADFFDFDAFANCFETGTCPAGRSADFDGDGFIDFFDFDAFVAAFEAGC